MSKNTSNIVRVALGFQLLALAFLLVFRSDSFLSYSYDLDPNEITKRVVLVAEFWDEQMNATGIADIRNRVIEFVEMLHGEEEF